MRSNVAPVTSLFPGLPPQPVFALAKIITQTESMCLTCSRRAMITCHIPGKSSEMRRQGSCRLPSHDYCCNLSVTDFWDFYRTRIKNEFEDGESCTVTLKDRFKPQDEESKDWYDRAFGAKRNIMRIELSLTPPPADIEPGKYRFFIKLNYAMFPEMKE